MHSIPSHLLAGPNFKPNKTFLLCVDGSPHSERAIQFVGKSVASPLDLVILCNVRKSANNHPMAIAGIPNDLTVEYEDSEKTISYSILTLAAEILAGKGVKVGAISLEGDARKAIIEEVRRSNPTMVVMGSRGMGPIKSAMLGSCSSYVISECPVPIMIVK